MKRTKKLILLTAVLAVLCAGIAIEKAVIRHVDSINTIDEEVIALDPDKITKLSWSNADGSLTFAKTDDGSWSDPDDSAFPVDQETVASFLENFKSIHASFIIEDVEDYASYGLTDPTATLEVTDDDDSTSTIKFGTYSTMDSKRYMELGDGKVYLIDTDPVENMTTERDDYLDRDEIYSYDIVDELTIETTGKDTLTIRHFPDEPHAYNEDWDYFLVDGDDYQPISNNRMNSWLSGLAGTSLVNYATYTASEEDLAKYGLDQPTMVITVAGTMDSSSETSEDTSEETSEETEAVPASYKITISQKGEEEIYMRVDDSPIIYKLDADDYDSISASTYNDLRPTNVVTLNWNQVDGLSAEVDDESFEVTVKHKKDENTFYMNDEKIDLTDVTDSIDALSVTDFDLDSKDGIKKALKKDPTIHLVLTLSNENYPTLDVKIYNFDSESCIVRLNDESIGLISRESMADLREALIRTVLNTETISS